MNKVPIPHKLTRFYIKDLWIETYQGASANRDEEPWVELLISILKQCKDSHDKCHFAPDYKNDLAENLAFDSKDHTNLSFLEAIIILELRVAIKDSYLFTSQSK